MLLIYFLSPKWAYYFPKPVKFKWEDSLESIFANCDSNNCTVGHEFSVQSGQDQDENAYAKYYGKYKNCVCDSHETTMDIYVEPFIVISIEMRMIIVSISVIFMGAATMMDTGKAEEIASGREKTKQPRWSP